MLQKIVKILLGILAVLLPLLASSLMSRYSPYFNGNGFGVYIAICLAYTFLSALVLFFMKDNALPRQLLYGGVSLFFLGACIASIFGLGAPPDLGTEMLQHPEREHFRYFMLSIALLLFVVAFFLIIKDKWDVFSKGDKLIVLFFVAGIVEMCWEFYHHYYYPENLQLWMDQGKKADEFVQNYDNFSMVRFGAIGRFFQFTVVAWLSFILLRYHHIKIWSFLLLLLFCFAGIFAAVFIFVNGLVFPKSLQMLFMFFIPGLPFILLYWLGVALMSKPLNNNHII
jgi:MFS family permease